MEGEIVNEGSSQGVVAEILIAESAGSKLERLTRARLEKGKGIEGDRYYAKQGTFSESLIEKGDFEITLIESEEIAAFNLAAGKNFTSGDFRRNFVTQHIRLNSLVGKTFYLGSAKLVCTRLCEPCAYLAQLLGDEVMQYMLHKAGIRAKIIDSGVVNPQDNIQMC